MTEWTVETVAERFQEAAQIARRLPPVKVQGYVCLWPEIVRQPWERYAVEDAQWRFPPSAQAIERMEETMRWVVWLREEDRHLVWMRARGLKWKEICGRFGCDRTTAWRRWHAALDQVLARLIIHGGLNPTALETRNNQARR